MKIKKKTVRELFICIFKYANRKKFGGKGIREFLFVSVFFLNIYPGESTDKK